MKNTFSIFAFMLLTVIFGCSSYHISNPVIGGPEDAGAIDSDLQSKLGKYRIDFGPFQKTGFKYIRQEILDGMANDGGIPVEKRNKIVADASKDLIWEDDRYFGFGVNYSQPWGFGKDDVVLIVTDIDGNEIPMHFYRRDIHVVSGETWYRYKVWLTIKSDQPVISEKVKFPLRFHFKILQKYTYTYTVSK